MPPSRALCHSSPTFHFRAPRGWLNDPCAPGHDVSTGTYHLFYQWNPKSCDWGDITWGRLISSDGLRWKQPDPEPVFKPDQPYDKEGIFTGCLYPTGSNGEPGKLTVFYTSACYLPINWTLNYHRNSAGLGYASSRDGGQTWEKGKNNPILLGEPEAVVVTGFRDPYLAPWSNVDKLRKSESLYGVISGGIRNQGGAVFLYEVSPTNILEWKYLGPILQLPERLSPSTQWDFGINWECAAFMTLSNKSMERDFFILGCEGAKPAPLSENDDSLVGYCLWMSGTLGKSDGLKMTYDFGGLLDHGCFYAPSHYQHPVTGVRILWGWIKEEDVTLAHCEEKGWRGMLSLPREIFLLSISDVVSTLATPLETIEAFHLTASDRDKDTSTVHTLGIRPWRDFHQLRLEGSQRWSSVRCGFEPHVLFQGMHWELWCGITLSASRSTKVGFQIQHNASRSQHTSIYFDTASEEIVVDRSTSNSDPEVGKEILKGHLPLLNIRSDGRDELEKLSMRIFCDGNVVEVFANERFAMSFMVYSDDPSCTGVSCFEIGDVLPASVFDSIEMWQLSNILID
ncbi:Arabinanase/levansucrase/invertase [Aureobasidium subglaciale]|nr:Arabinanase/levansucrase/invertase [Aureobasidium subglaciale]